jgi:hypothetical protein
LFIAVCRCQKIKFKNFLVYIHFKFTGVAYGKHINSIVVVFDAQQFDFMFYKKHEYIIYLEFSHILNNTLYGNILFYQDLEQVRVNII